MSEYEKRTGRSKYFRIQKNDAGTEAYQDHYVHDLESEIERLRQLNEDKHRHLEAYRKAASEDKAEVERLRAERDEAREAARWLFQGGDDMSSAMRGDAVKQWWWLGCEE